MESLQKFLQSNAIEPNDQLQERFQQLMVAGNLVIHDTANSATHITYVPPTLRKRTTTSIVSSRLGRKLDKRDEFFRVLRIACSQLDPRRQVLLSAKGTSTHTFVTRAAELFGLDVLEVQIADSNTSLEQWLVRCSRLSSDDNVLMVWPLKAQCSSPPLRDLVVVCSADQVLAIHLRKRGNTYALLSERTKQHDPSRIYLAIGNQHLVTQCVANPLMEQGAIGWYLMSSENSIGLLNTAGKTNEKQAIYSLAELPNTEIFLTHCTRGTHGPWPDQTETDFLDELILGKVSRDRSALSALTRIVGQRRILATGEAIRTGASVVSLTSVALTELRSLRQFRSHRGRWDFEPYGIAIDRDFLVKRGARPAIYGDEKVWDSLPAEDQPYFQRVGDEKNSIDWRVEKEFRMLGDIDLDSVPTDKAFAIVPNQEEAEHLAGISKWPIVIMDNADKCGG